MKSRTQPSKTVNYFAQQVDWDRTFLCNMVEKRNIENEVAADEDQVDEVENELLLEPLLLVVQFDELDLVLEIIVYCFQQKATKLKSCYDSDIKLTSIPAIR